VPGCRQKGAIVLRGKPKLLLLGATLVSTVVLVATASINVLAGEGNPNYLGIVSSSAPSGYTPSPASYTTGSTVSFTYTLTNLTAQQQSLNLQLNFDHFIQYDGINVSDGQPGVTNGAVVDGSAYHPSVQVQDPSPTYTAVTLAPNATVTMHMSRAMPAGQCGYYQVDVVKAGLTSQKGLIGFYIRILGCVTATPAPSPTPTALPSATPSASPTPSTSPTPSGSPSPESSPTPTPSGGVGAATGSPSPSGGVLGSTATTPPTGAVLADTGMTSPAEVIALVLFAFGALVVITALAWRRQEKS
jgi:hypothetical protein